MSTKDKNIVIGNVGIDDDEFEPRNVKVRVTTMIDEDILDTLKQIAKEKGQKYQTLLNQVLRSFIENRNQKKSRSNEERIREIVREEIKRLR